MRASIMPCSFFAAWYSKFSERSPNSPPALILATLAGARTGVGKGGWGGGGSLWGLVVVDFGGGSYYLWHAPFHVGPVFFGLAFSLLLIATYPQRKDLVPSTSRALPPPIKTPTPASSKDEPGEEEKD